MNLKYKHTFLVPLLIIILILCSLLWYLRAFYRDDIIEVTEVYSQTGIWDLSGIDFDETIIKAYGNVANIENEILSPTEFDLRIDEAVVSSPIDVNSARTAKLIFIMPTNNTYAIHLTGDYARSVYINGEHRGISGHPGATPETFEAGHELMTFHASSQTQQIEMVVAGGNFVHRTSSGYDEVLIGKPEIVELYISIPIYVEILTIGLLFALFIAHFSLSTVFHKYSINLSFALLCIVWCIRFGLTGTKVFYEIFPDMIWDIAYRIERMTVPLTAILLIFLIRRQFAGSVSRIKFIVFVTIFSVFTISYAFLSTYIISYLAIILSAFYVIAITIVIIDLIKWVPRNIRTKTIYTEHFVAFVSLAVFFVAATVDGIYYINMDNFPDNMTISETAMLVFASYEMISMFFGTTRRVEIARQAERESRIRAEQLESFMQMKAHFMTIIAHEIKTPLAVIMGGADETLELINMEDIDFDTIENDQKIIINTVKDLNATVFDLLDTTALETGRLSVERLPLNLGDFLHKVAKQYHMQIERKGNKLTVEVEEDLPLVYADEKRLRQVLLNLLSNASRHTFNGEVSIKLWERNNKQYVSVSDTGTGISTDVLGKLTKGYIDGGPHGFRGGIGMYVCQQIVYAHGGDITIGSKEGIGTSVTFSIPQQEDEE